MVQGGMRGSDTDTERVKVIKYLIRESMEFDLSRDESIEYISRRLNERVRQNSQTLKKISVPTFYKYKKQVELTDDTVNERMFKHAKTGFVVKHFQILDTAEVVAKNLAAALFTATRPIEKAALSQQLLAFLAFIRDQNVGSPIIEQMKQYVEDNLIKKDAIKSDEVVDNTTEYEPSALVIPQGFIKSIHDETNDSGGISAGKKSGHAVFEKARKPEGSSVLDDRSDKT